MIEDSVSEPGRRDGGDAGKRLAWLQRQVLPVLEEGDAVWVSGLDGAPFAGGAHKVVEASAAGELPGNERFRLACLGGAVGGVADDWQAMRLLLRAVESLEDRGWLLLEEVLSVCAAGACRSPQAQARLALSLGLRQVAELHLGAPDDGGRQRVLQLFRQDLAVARMQRYSGLRVACYGNMPFHYRSLRPLAECFEDSLLSLDIDEVMAWKPDVIAVADGWSVEFWRDYCDAHNVLLVGMRHGSVTRYGFAEGTYRYADYLCGSAWDIDDTLASSVMPRNGFLLTGNAWCDEVFRLPARTPAENAPTILFAPTYNPEISAAVHLGERVVALIRKVYPASRIIIKPHPAIVQHEHAFVSDKDLFRDLMKLWREQSRTDPLVTLVDDPEASIAASFAEADILLADRSSLIFEFMTLDRPILLFSREQRIARWAYNPEAPGNAWRDIGLEFADDEQLLDLLANAFTRHAESRDTQENRTQQLYGRFRDGRSVQRVAAAIAEAPRLQIVLDARAAADGGQRLAEHYAACFAHRRIDLIAPSGAALPADVRRFDSWRAWCDAEAATLERRASAVLLVEDDGQLLPGSAHQVSALLPAIAMGQLRHARLALEEREAGPAGETDWSARRLHRLLARLQPKPAWRLLAPALLREELADLPDEAEQPLWLRAVAAAEAPVEWPVGQLNLFAEEGLLRQGDVHMLCARARLRAVPCVSGLPLRQRQVVLQVTPFASQLYDRFPFQLRVCLNGQLFSRVSVEDARAKSLVLPFRGDERGGMTIELECDGSYPAFEGVSTPVSLLLQTAFQPAPGDYCAALAAGAASPEAGEDFRSEYETWLHGREVEPARYRPFIDALRRDSRIEVLVLAEEAEDADLQRSLASIDGQALPAWRTRILGRAPAFARKGLAWLAEGGSAAERINLAAAASDADWLIVIHAGDELARSALLLLAEKIRTETALLCCYSDEDHVCDGRYEAPLLKPDFNLDLLRSYPYCGRSLAFQRAALLAQGGLQEGFGDLALQDFMFRLAEREGLDRIGHLAEVLYHSARAFGEWLASAAVRPFIASVVDEHLNRLGVPHRIEPGRLAVINRIAYDYPGTPAVSLLLPVGDSLSALQRSVESFLENTDYPSYELLLVASGPLAPDMAAWLEAVQGLGSEQIRVLSPQASSLAGCLNLCVAEARGEFLLSLGRGSWPFVRTGCASCSTTATARRSGRSAASSWAWTERFARRAWCLAWAARRAARSPARRETAPATCIACWSSRITRLCRLPACCSSARCTTNSAASTRTTSLMATPTSISACVPASSATCRCGRPMQSWPRTETSSCLPWRPMSRSTGAGYRHWRGIPRTTAISAWRGPGSPWSAPRYRPGNRCSDGRRCRGSWRILPIPTVVATIACVSRSARCTTPACWTACSASRSCSRWRWSAWRSTA
ncbi:CDP-glycerol glycerophosphotransferase family protein [Pseudomonas aeruginosa]|uniref:CDP-glycerol glycerophosphotransferase family protein n=1 Tax=Pseudomonas aeruginosa TaxID=287 RepID=UPI001DE4FE01|nr:CDP-glycerol glycerophosphotransferase family protein [Pseudomonas aeruginosa]ELH4040693.1 CDP-glycerol glycerophosphotransferase family protein [Pseudomonas aeruginosa]ELM3837322.1 CDP-glycerol glycerophosphotransferase family protein [Pseudomonas aeruginosa]ELO2145506.1 CDP-glycerol glycerophosphotransferase family protein [Pseudomonas aeruginosa]MBN0075729.1 CDP-glycerol glycerophosphotransferase family protein [Pseudomonas aeruginosa]MBN0083153.1 CDP-glycerol glycerophosphotransferase f